MAQERSFTHLVVIGSSAGGVDALTILVSTLRSDFAAPIVIAQHIDPNRPSHLGDILGRRTMLPVRTVAEHEPLLPGTIYVVPSNRNVYISDSVIEIDQDGDTRPKPSVDLLLSSAADVYGEHLIAVILSGTGSDGAAGARAVKKAGGTVIIQNPETASYPGMPLSLAPSTVDIVANVERIGPILSDLLMGVSVPAQPDERQVLEAFLEEVRDRFELDFNSYKRPTVLRRLQRRILATDTENLNGYIQFTQDHPEEYQQLINAFLIKVTEFLRDGELYEFVQKEIVPALITYASRHGNELRIWSAGCATGEEAYSLAIVLLEALGPTIERFNIRIFATDADANAIEFARRGIYPASALARVPEELIAKYFTRDENNFQVRKRVRALTVFGQHDLGQRAPFPHIDMIVCRNVLIYFTSELQQRTLKLFAFSLRDGGYLVLGKAESPGQMNEFFQLVDKIHKVYKREGERILIPPARTHEPLPKPAHRLPLFRRPAGPMDLSPGQKEMQRARTSNESIISRLPIGIVLVNRSYDIQMINSAARRFLSIHGTAIGEDFVHLAERVSSAELRSAIDEAFRSGAPAEMGEFVLEDVGSGEPRYYSLACYPQRFERDDGPFEVVMVVVQDITSFALERRGVEQQLESTSAALGEARTTARHDTERREQLVQQLIQTNRQLLEANQGLTSANEELRTTNEEFLLSNEEAQAAIEEVETLNEELQATNEELETLNEELQSTIEELNTTYDDLHARSVELQDLARNSEEERARLAAILGSMADAVLVVDKFGNPLLTNAAFERMFGSAGARLDALDEDGRALPREMTPHYRAAQGESFSMEFTLTDAKGERRWFEANGQPVGDAGSALSVGVLIIRDITERSLHRLQDQFIMLASHELRTPIQVLQTGLQLLQRSNGAQAGENAQRAAELAIEQTQRMSRLVDDLLDAAQLQIGKFTLAQGRLRFDELARRVVETAQLLSSEHQVTFSDDAGAVSIMGDAQRLEQAILNLVTNAMRHAPESIRIDLTLRRHGNEALLDVRDYGPGIPTSDLPHLFTRFIQAPGSAADDSGRGGLGLELYIAQQIVAAHGGSITVANNQGQGATFTIHLPIAVGKTSKR